MKKLLFFVLCFSAICGFNVLADDMNYRQPVGISSNPVGSIILYPGASAPTGYLICDGAAISRTTYSDLYAVIGTVYGIGNGSTTFNLPNLKGRVPVGLNSAETEFDALGETGGAKTHTLSAT